MWKVILTIGSRDMVFGTYDSQTKAEETAKDLATGSTEVRIEQTR
jgi:hypothetical protein